MHAIAEAAGPKAEQLLTRPGRFPSRPAFLLFPRPIVGFGWRGLRRVEPRQRRAQRVKPRRAGISVVPDAAPNRRRYRGLLVVGEVPEYNRAGKYLECLNQDFQGGETSC
jgi:hypothetical protein